MNAPIQHVQAVSATTAEALLYTATSNGAGQLLNLQSMSLAEVEALLGGTLEVVQLDAQTCLLTNAQAQEQHRAKNLPASHRYFARNPESGAAGDFIRGEAILCQTSQMQHLNHLYAELKPQLTTKQRADRAAAFRSFGGQQEYEQAKTVCSLENPGGCEMCGS